MADSQHFSLSELNQHLHRVVAFNMREQLWIRCELADVSASRGHLYLSLIERDEFQTKARANGVFWKHRLQKVQEKIGDSFWTILQPGSEVLILIEVEFSELYGLQLVVQDVDLSFTIGKLELERAANLRKLEAEQFLDLNKQLDFASVPQRIAVISSETAAGLQDFREQLRKNPYGYQFKLELFAAAMQGQAVEQEVLEQIELIEARQAEFDCIVLVRGGGAKLDLMGFDSYKLCVAMATCELPVLTGIGHDIDETLADLVAYQALKTPTAVADFLINRLMNYEATMEQLYQQIQQFAQYRLQSAESELNNLAQQLALVTQNKLAYHEQLLANLDEKLDLLNPQNTLNRGFAMLLNADGEVIKSLEEAKRADGLRIRLADGEIEVKLNEEE